MQAARHARRLLPLLFLAVGLLPLPVAWAGDGDAGDKKAEAKQAAAEEAAAKKAAAKKAAAKKADAPDSAQEAARKNAIKGLRSKIHKLATSPRVAAKKADLLKLLEALAALGGKEAGKAALAALPAPDDQVRDAAFDIVEREHDKTLVKPLVQLLEDKHYRRDADARRRLAHALAVMSDPAAIEPLAALLRFDEDAEVVAEAADGLASYAAVAVAKRKPAVRRLVDLYESTWNLKESVRTEPRDKLLKKQALDRYKVYGKSLRFALQALTGVQLTRPQEWRRWWNSNKKRSKWGRHSVLPKSREHG